jgi:hypothetical protein
VVRFLPACVAVLHCVARRLSHRPCTETVPRALGQSVPKRAPERLQSVPMRLAGLLPSPHSGASRAARVCRPSVALHGFVGKCPCGVRQPFWVCQTCQRKAIDAAADRALRVCVKPVGARQSIRNRASSAKESAKDCQRAVGIRGETAKAARGSWPVGSLAASLAVLAFVACRVPPGVGWQGVGQRPPRPPTLAFGGLWLPAPPPRHRKDLCFGSSVAGLSCNLLPDRWLRKSRPEATALLFR